MAYLRLVDKAALQKAGHVARLLEGSIRKGTGSGRKNLQGLSVQACDDGSVRIVIVVDPGKADLFSEVPDQYEGFPVVVEERNRLRPYGM